MLDTSDHGLSTLFAQLGLKSDKESIESFFNSHSLDNSTPLLKAKFWNQGQRQFLQESLEQDGDWSEQIDILDARLRH